MKKEKSAREEQSKCDTIDEKKSAWLWEPSVEGDTRQERERAIIDVLNSPFSDEHAFQL